MIFKSFYNIIKNKINKKMNKKNVSMLILESDNTKITIFDLTFKGEIFHYKVVKSVADFLELLMAKQWDYIFVQHDLYLGRTSISTDPESGYSALLALFENYQYRDEIRKIIIHTENIVGARNMLELAYVAGFDENKIIHLIFNSSEFKAEILKIKKEIETI